MKKTKIIAILSALVILTAMTGIAAADDVDIVYNGTNNDVSHLTIPLGGSANVDLNVSGFIYNLGTIHNITVDLEDLNGNPVTGLTITITEQVSAGSPTPTGSWYDPTDNPVVRWNQSFSSTTQDPAETHDWERFDVTISETKGTPEHYLLRISDYRSGTTTVSEVFLDAATIDIQVPEFATIAIPAVAILGLFLFFNHRKHKKE